MFDCELIYTYDGTFDGFLSCVFSVYENREIPRRISETKNLQNRLDCEYKHITTDREKSDRVYASIRDKISYRAIRNVFYAFLSDKPNKERLILDYIRAGYQYGRRVDNHLLLNPVNFVVSVERFVRGEAHRMLGFVRFSELEQGVYYSAIQPKNNVLPIIAPHFAHRFANMPWLIHDRGRNLCLVHLSKNWYITDAAGLPALKFSDGETKYRKLWRQFYKTLEIKERHNEKLQKSFVPLYYRRYLTEFY